MKKFKIEAKSFNNHIIYPHVDIYFKPNEVDTTLPKGIYSEILEAVEIEKFRLISKDIEKLKKNNITLYFESIKEEIILFLKERTRVIQTNVVNQHLKNAQDFYEQKKYTSSKNILAKIDTEALSEFDKLEYLLLKFKLLASKTYVEFKKCQDLFVNFPSKEKELYFAYIKYLEDKREEKSPKRVIQEFEKKYDLESLSKQEKSLYYYLKGRAEYERGEFLLALKYLALAKENTAIDDEKFLANIYNTTANCFTDNLFFDEALELGQKALNIREELQIVQKYESVSLIAGVYLKANEPHKAYEKYEESLALLEGNNDDKKSVERLYNYLARSSLLLGHTDKAREYLALAKKVNDNDRGFVTLIELLFSYIEKDYDKMMQIYKETFFFLDIKKKYDKFVLAWGYTLLARSCIEQKKEEEGIEYLYRATDFFVEDLYILEAYYISMYIYSYNISTEYMNTYNELISSFEIKRKMKEYVLKHQNIVKDYYEIFGVSNTKKCNLKEFYDETSYINQETYYPEVVESILNKFNLI